MKGSLIFVTSFFIFCLSLHGQQDSSAIWINLDSIEITGAKISRPWLSKPSSAREYSFKELRSAFKNASLQEYLLNQASVYSINSNNYAQDLRISIRGFGMRSSFGVRGIRLLVDGIPESTPDGQGQLDAIPLGLIQNIELLRGPNATLHGNGAGGVLNITTLSPENYNLDSKPLRELKLMFGSYNLRQYQFTYGQKLGKAQFILHGNQTEGAGYRGHSTFKSRFFKGRFDYKFSRYSKVNVSFDWAASPVGMDAGALTLQEVEEDRAQGRQRNIDFNAGEKVDQLKLALNYELLTSDLNKFNLYAFGVKRNFDGLLPFENGGAVDLDRLYFGQGIYYTINSNWTKAHLKLKYGYDFAKQIDTRKRSINDFGVIGALTNDQVESFENLGLFVLSDLSINDLVINAGLRFDYNQIKIDDLFLSDDPFAGSASGLKSFSVFNPSFGLSHPVSDLTQVFANFSTNFETPSITELTANPNSFSGLNSELEPQKSRNYELGIKSNEISGLEAQLVFFSIVTTDELVRYSLDSLDSRIFFRNAGKTNRRGIELELSYHWTKALSTTLAYTMTAFKFDEFVTTGIDLTGKRLPGLPSNQLSFNMIYKWNENLDIQLQNRLIGKVYLDDENLHEEPSNFVSNLLVSYNWVKPRYRWVPFIGINNITHTSYNDNLRINAAGGRFYEPAPGINFHLGLKLEL